MASEDTVPARRRFRLGGRRWLRYLLIVAGIVSLLVAAGGAVAALWAFTILPRTLPSVTALETFQPLVGTKLYDDNDELITELHVERRIFVPLAHIPQSLRDAVIATEDKRFYYHWGIDPIGIARAVAQNYRRGRIVEGGSTITQQLTKLLFLTPDKSLERKMKEAVLALELERRYSKDRILEMYLNQVYFGHGAYGVEAASRTYFGKSVSELNVRESALLAGLPRAPTTYSPFDHAEIAKRRREVVLRRMVEFGALKDADAKRLARADLGLIPPERRRTTGQYFLDFVQQGLEAKYGADMVFKGGLNVYTTLNPTMQLAAEQAVRDGLKALEGRTKTGKPGEHPEGALVTIEPQTGYVRAMVGGYDFFRSEFNRATQARRQPGSAFKPFIYIAALESGFTAASRVEDLPLTLESNGQPWSPRNSDDRYEGVVTVQQALEQSLNSATVRIAQTVGLPTVIDLARALGIQSQLAPVPAIALGAFEVTPLELTRAYVPLANGGMRPAAGSTIRTVQFGDDEVKPAIAEEPSRVVSPAEAWLVTSLLKGVVTTGTGRAVRSSGLPDVVAGKTGTTNDGRDAWFVGYTPKLLALVWVGLDSGEAHGMSGARAALPIWIDFMKQAVDAYPQPNFDVPSGIAFADIDVTNGKRAVSACPVVAREAFLVGTEPPLCDEHRGVIDHVVSGWNRLKEWFGRSREPKDSTPQGDR